MAFKHFSIWCRQSTAWHSLPRLESSRENHVLLLVVDSFCIWYWPAKPAIWFHSDTRWAVSKCQWWPDWKLRFFAKSGCSLLAQPAPPKPILSCYILPGNALLIFSISLLPSVPNVSFLPRMKYSWWKQSAKLKTFVKLHFDESLFHILCKTTYMRDTSVKKDKRQWLTLSSWLNLTCLPNLTLTATFVCPTGFVWF